MKHEGAVWSAQFSPDGQRVVTASSDQTARVWDAATGNPIGEPMNHDEIPHRAQFSPDGQRVVTAGGLITLRGCGMPQFRQTHCRADETCEQPSGERILVLMVERVVTASWDRTARLWDAFTGKPIGEPMKHGGRL